MHFVIQIAAMLLSPLVALQISQVLTARKERRKRRQALFQTLMATRGANNSAGRLSREHVQALNMIDIEFHGEKRARPTLEAWKAYLDHLNTPTPGAADDPGWAVLLDRRDELLTTLLYEMGRLLGYSFDKTDIRRASYSPRGFDDLEFDSFALRKAVLELLNGARALPVTTRPPSPSTSNGQPALKGGTPDTPSTLLPAPHAPEE